MSIRPSDLPSSAKCSLLIGVATVLVGLAGAGAVHAHGTWHILARPADHDLNKVSFVNDVNGWVAGDAGTILVTRDGGLTWDAQVSPVGFDIIDIDMLDGQVGWALAQYRGASSSDYKSVVLSTKNGGGTWAVRGSFDELYHAIGFGTQSRGVICGERGKILYTQNGGSDWEGANIATPEPARWSIRNVDFHSSTFGLAMGGQYDVTGVVWRTLDGGQTWTHDRVAGEPVFASFAFDAENILCVGDFTDLGIWGQAEGVAFRDPFEGWAPLGFAGTCMYTMDSGHTWTSISTPDGTPMHDVVFTSDEVGYMVGNNGVVLGYSPQTETGVEEVALRGDGALLAQNTPNPFRPETQFAFRVPEKKPVTLKVYDTAGREVATVVNETMLPGSYTRTFDAGALTAGVYYYRLTVGKHVETRKMVLVR